MNMNGLKYAALIALCVGEVLVQAQDATPTASPCADAVNTMAPWTLTDTSCSLHDNIALSFDASYPHDLAEKSPAAGQAMLDYINQQRLVFWQTVGDVMNPDFFPPAPLATEITYETFQHSSAVNSVLFNVYSYTGGAHPNTYFQTFTFNTDTNTVYTLADLFKTDVAVPDVLVPFVRADLQETLKDFPDFIESGTDPHPDQTTYPGLDNYANWVLTPDALVIYFPPYQVAPYVAGPQQVSIPLAELKDMLNPDVVCLNGAECLSQ